MGVSRTSVIRINPDTLEYQDVTGLGVPGRRSLTYGYYMAIEPPWVYVAVGQGQWELWSVDGGRPGAIGAPAHRSD